jgi:integrase
MNFLTFNYKKYLPMKMSVGQKKPLTKNQIKKIKTLLSADGNLRDIALFSFSIDSMLRSSDILNLKVADFVDTMGNMPNTIDLRQKKTGKTVTIQLQDDTIEVLKIWIESSSKERHEYVFTGRKKTNQPISHVQHTRLVKKWVGLLEIDPQRYSTHSMRRSKSSIVYAETKDVEICRQLLGQSNTASTSHYLGIEKDDALKIAAAIRL